jgi:tetratricopeptide (TPR) repeat protein
MRVWDSILRVIFYAFLLSLLGCNAKQGKKDEQSVTSPGDQGKAVQSQPPRPQPPKSQEHAAPTAKRQPGQTPQAEKSITYAKNPERFAPQQTFTPKFNVTNPKTAQEHFNVALESDHHDQLDTATEEYKKALELEPGWALAHFRLGQDYDKQGRTDDAIAHWEQAVRYDPQLYIAYGRLADRYQQQGNLKKAIEAYTPLLKYRPALLPTHYQLGVWYAKLGDRKNATEHLQSYRELALKSKTGEAKSKRFQQATRELHRLKQ